MRTAGTEKGQTGFSLVEVAVAAAVFSLGLGGLSLLLLLAVQGTVTPRLETLAAVHARSLTEAARFVPGGVEALPLAGAGPAGCSAAAPCPPGVMAATIMESWQQRVEKDIPTGRGLVCRDSVLLSSAGGECGGLPGETVSVDWDEADADGDGTAPRRFEIGLTPR